MKYSRLSIPIITDGHGFKSVRLELAAPEGGASCWIDFPAAFARNIAEMILKQADAIDGKTTAEALHAVLPVPVIEKVLASD